MANLAQVMKSEITRLARKEVRQEMSGLRKAATQHRKDIAELKRQLKKQQSLIARLQKASAKSGAAVQPTEEPGERLRFSAKGLRSHRQKLGLSAADYAALVGVSPQTIYLWEREQTKPRRSQLPAVAAVRKLGVREAIKRLEEME